ncbi:COQ9-domain-containing protein [Scheffersomyces xylosifermentans]|uniref:COQ9-domain-containing protein n=1 Tax=Scheffersomyces xylosifermentans TaxID=1304137 RepID=UPI00315D9A85
MLKTPFRGFQAFRGGQLALNGLKNGVISTRLYHSRDHPSSNKIVDPKSVESVLLTKALEYIPQYGFSNACITQAIRELDYPDSIHSAISTNPSGNSPEFQLTLHWLKTQRQKLEQHILDPNSEYHKITDEYERVSYAIKKRLEFNEPVVGRLVGGISQLVVPYNIPQSLEELHNLSDDIAFYAGDMSHDFAWYSKRVGFSSIYVSSELYMLQDSSDGYRRTKNFVDEKVLGLKGLGSAYNDIEEWGIFNAISLVNMIKSQLVRG